MTGFFQDSVENLDGRAFAFGAGHGNDSDLVGGEAVPDSRQKSQGPVVGRIEGFEYWGRNDPAQPAKNIINH